MKRRSLVRLVLGGLAAVLASILLAAGYQVVGDVAITKEMTGASAGAMARVHAEEVSDAEHDAFRFARVLVPLTMAAVWWRGRRKERAT